MLDKKLLINQIEESFLSKDQSKELIDVLSHSFNKISNSKYSVHVEKYIDREEINILLMFSGFQMMEYTLRFNVNIDEIQPGIMCSFYIVNNSENFEFSMNIGVVDMESIEKVIEGVMFTTSVHWADLTIH